MLHDATTRFFFFFVEQISLSVCLSLARRTVVPLSDAAGARPERDVAEDIHHGVDEENQREGSGETRFALAVSLSSSLSRHFGSLARFRSRTKRGSRTREAQVFFERRRARKQSSSVEVEEVERSKKKKIDDDDALWLTTASKNKQKKRPSRRFASSLVRSPSHTLPPPSTSHRPTWTRTRCDVFGSF